MNGIEKITARIEADTRAEIDQILQEAKAQAEQIRADYAAKAQTEANADKEVGKQAAARQAERLESAAHMEAKQMLLQAKQACVDEAFDEAHKKLVALPDEEYADLLAKIAVHASQNGKEEVILNAKDRERVGESVVAKANAMTKVPTSLTLSAEVADIEGGLILRSGNIEVNCAFETQLRILRENMTAEIAGILFAQ